MPYTPFRHTDHTPPQRPPVEAWRRGKDTLFVLVGRSAYSLGGGWWWWNPFVLMLVPALVLAFSTCGADCAARSYHVLRSRSKGRVDWAKLDVAESDGIAWVRGLDRSWDSGGRIARSTRDTRGGCGFVGRVVRIKPEHVGAVVVPDRHDKDHAQIKLLAEGFKSTLLGEVVRVTESRLLSGAEGVSDGVSRDPRDV